VDDKGFTLIEVLTAVTVMSIVLGLVISLFGGGLRSVRTAQGYSRALLIAEEKLDEGIITDDSDSFEPEDSGAVNGYAWERSVTPFTPAPESGLVEKDDLYRVEVRVNWKEGVKRKEVALYALGAGRAAEVDGL
jgi:prepilin-type N-terminal cleavage/methylation domain-containing protein